MTNRNENQEDSFKKASEMLTRMSHDSDLPPRPGFKEALKQRILDVRQHTRMPSFSWFNGWSPKFAYGGTVALVAVIILMLVLNPFSKTIPLVYAQDNFTLTADSEDSLGIDPSTQFILESKEPIAMDFLKSSLKTSPEIPFDLEKIDDHHVRVQFTQELDSGTMVRFLLSTELANSDGTTQLRPYSWAFQVKNTFHVLSSIPGNKTGGVPLDSGIEFTLSHENISVEAFDEAFSISPNIEGHIEKNNRHFVFVPKKLEPATVYTGTISASLHPNGSEQTLGKDYSVTFETVSNEGEMRSDRLSVSEKIVTTNPTAKAEFQFGYYNYYDQSDDLFNVSLQVFRFPSFETFRTSVGQSTIDSWRLSRSYKEYVPVSTLTSVGTFTPEIRTENYTKMAQLPVTLEEGYYGVLVTKNAEETWFFIQSVSVSATVVSANEKSLVWAHDLLTKQPAADAVIRELKITSEAEQQIQISDTGKTGKDGAGFVKVSNEAFLVEVSVGNRTVLLSLNQNQYWGWGGWWRGEAGGASVDDDYVGYMYSDRSVYMQQDQVQVWGFLKKRNGDTIPKKANLTLSSSVYGYERPSEYSQVEYLSVPVELNDQGFFTGRFSLPLVSSDGYSIGLDFGDITPLARGIQVQEYRKPVYTLDLSLDRHAVIAGDSRHFEAQVKYFDGTPAQAKKVNVGTDWDEGVGYVTGSDGIISGDISIPNTGINSVRSQLAEPGQMPASSSQWIHVFDSSVQIQAEGRIKKDIVSVDIDTRRVEIVDSDLVEDHMKNPRPNTQVDVKATQRWYEQIPNGEYYDFIRKSVVKSYRYEEHVDTVYTNKITTDANGKATISFPRPRQDASYEVVLSATDDQNRSTSTSVYPYSVDESGNDYYSYFYSPDNNDESLSFKNLGYNPETYGDPLYKVDEQVQLEVQQFGRRFEMIDDGQFLFFQAQRGVQEYSVATEPAYTFSYEERDIPNIYVFGVLFTGREYITVDSYGYYTSGKYVGFDTESRKLDVQVTMDATSYRPGATAKATVQIKDSSGKPVAAEVNLSVVDEAYFSVFPDSADPLGSLYRYLPSGITEVLVSHKPAMAMGGAEGGGGGDGDVRSRFVDTASFVTAKTGNDGRVVVDLPLADNVTSWRITTQAIDSKLVQAGITTTNVTTTLPFFITAAVQPTYLTEDRPSIIVTAAGKDVRPNDKITYQLSIENTSISATLETTVGARAHLSLSQLPEGTHKILIKAKTGTHQDAVEHVTHVVRSRLTIPSVEEQILTPETKLSGSENGLTYVTFMDKTQGQFYQALLRLSGRYGDRADEAVTRSVATQLLNEMFEEDALIPEIDVNEYQESEGAIRLLSYASSEPILTAKVALLEQTPFDELRMRGSLLSALYRTEQGGNPLTQEEAAWALAGLAALDAPVLSETRRFAQEQTLSEEAKLAVAIAYLYAGDAEHARPIYQELMKDAKRDLGFVWVERSTPEIAQETNAQLMLLAAGFNEEKDFEGLQAHLYQYAGGETLTLLEQLAAIKQAKTFLRPNKSVFSYTLRGETGRVELEHGGKYTVAVSSEELAALNPKAEQGSVSVTTSYEKPLTSLTSTYQKISLRRTYRGINGQEQASFKEGDVVRVEIAYRIDSELPGEYFQVTDAIPSGLTPMTWRDGNTYDSYSGAANSYCVTYPNTDTDQRLSFFVYNEIYSYSCPKNTIVYYARVMNTGTFKAEAASIRATEDPSLFNFSNESTITITE